MSIPDHPVIRNCERTGYPDGKVPEYPVCPRCKRECETITYNSHGDVLGCDLCTNIGDAWEEPQCFPGGYLD